MPSIKTGPSTMGLQILAIPAVVSLVCFLGYSSQWLFHTATDLTPGKLTTSQTTIFNTLLLCLWYTYYKACTVSPGRYTFLTPSTQPHPSSTTAHPPPRWCKKCLRPKPPRAHHCRHCARCVPKMDHHCPWTGNCVSLQTFPHFLRFLVFTNLSLWYLCHLLFLRFLGIWRERRLPAYLGPTLPALVHVTVLALVCSATTLALGVMMYTTVQGWVVNTTMIEGWEVERHEAVVERGAESWWAGDDDEGRQGVSAVEFPYDLGFFANMAQAMGTRNVLAWFFPFAGGPMVTETVGEGVGWEWEENGFNEREGMWPPPDPEKMRRARTGWPGAAARAGGLHEREYGSPEEEKAAFAARQARWRSQGSGIIGELGEGEELDDYDDDDYSNQGMDGEPGWTNADGDRLRDFGVDEDAEVDEPLDEQSRAQQDEDIPLGELLRRRKVRSSKDDAT